MTMDLDRVRILVLGDSGVGKTSLVHLISRGKPLSHITYTIGASIEVKLHEYREGTPSQRPYWIELCDLGGSHGHRNSRHVFYNNYHGLILVHDLTNRKSEQNLERWLREIVQFSSSTNGKHKDWDDVLTHEDDASNDLNVPLLVIGTKQDLESNRGSLPVHQKRSHVAEDYGTEEIHLNCTDTKSTVPGSSASNKLSRFFDKVIEKHFYRRDKSGSGTFSHAERSERRRLV
eukprot:07134.XXX_145424_144023_1 [CDS] Oithona nana genome sequencing.